MRIVLVLAALLLPLPAMAHAILMASDPAPQSKLLAGPLHVSMRFNSRIDEARSRLELRDAGGGTATPLTLKPGQAADSLVADTTVAKPGQYVLRWQVLAVDGHMTRGEVPFTVQAP